MNLFHGRELGVGGCVCYQIERSVRHTSYINIGVTQKGRGRSYRKRMMMEIINKHTREGAPVSVFTSHCGKGKKSVKKREDAGLFQTLFFGWAGRMRAIYIYGS